MRNLQQWRGASHQLGLTCLFGLFSLFMLNTHAHGKHARLEDSQSNQAVVERYMKAYINKDWKVLSTLLADDASFSDPTVQAISPEAVQLKGKAEVLKFFQEQYADLTMRFEQQHAVFSTNQASISGQLDMTMPMQRRIVRSVLPITTTLSIRNGLIVQHTDYVDYRPFIAAEQASRAAPVVAKSSFVPSKEWEMHTKPEDIGYSSKKLQGLDQWLKGLDTTALQVIVNGKVLFQYGDLKHQSYLASARKSLLSLLYGKYIENGTISLASTLQQLNIDDVGGLSDRERKATIGHLLAARSGIYHPASNPGDFTDRAPKRDSVEPGSYNLYNNWDFNVAGTIFEQLSKSNIYQAFEKDVAQPIGMQDFNLSLQQKGGDANRSRHPAYHFWLSTRDMARVGQLMLREGNWNGQQVVPTTWVKQSTSLITPMREMNPPERRGLGSGTPWGYGYMWWVWDATDAKGVFEGSYTAAGAMGQFITVIPKLDMVIAHKTDPGARGDRSVSNLEYDAIVRMIVASRCAQACGHL